MGRKKKIFPLVVQGLTDNSMFKISSRLYQEDNSRSLIDSMLRQATGQRTNTTQKTRTMQFNNLIGMSGTSARRSSGSSMMLPGLSLATGPSIKKMFGLGKKRQRYETGDITAMLGWKPKKKARSKKGRR